MIAWALIAAMLIVGLLLLSVVAPGLARGWRTVTRAFIAAPLMLVALTVVSSVT